MNESVKEIVQQLLDNGHEYVISDLIREFDNRLMVEGFDHQNRKQRLIESHEDAIRKMGNELLT